MNLYAEIKENKLNANLSFDKVYVGGDNKEAKRLLYNWMLSKGYAVTASMTILQMVRLLVGAIKAKFSISGKKVVIEDAQAKIEGKKVILSNGVSINGKKIKWRTLNEYS